jgi:ABC-2 type transport system ATP-binding protein
MLATYELSKRFGSVRALNQVSMRVPEGSVFALIGPNGAGKSTAIRILMNLLRATSGRAEVLGADSRKLGPGELAQIGYVSENRQLPDWMTVGRFFAYSKGFYPGWREGDLEALRAAYDLPLDRPLKFLSRGMRLKAAMASALAYRPRLLVLDEPFAGLDLLVREQMIESILERTPETTVFLASHDLAEIESFATHVAYLDEGRVRFVEEMGALADRFREIEAVFEGPPEIPAGVPAAWLNPGRSGLVVRFTHSRYEAGRSEAEVRRLLPGLRDLSVRAIPLRGIFVALAKSARAGGVAGGNGTAPR